MRFPANFVWGTASSAYQIEGSPRADGGGESIWDVLCRTPGKIFNNENGDIAADAYHRYAEDIALMASLGLHAYRFSLSWARVDPLGDGSWNEAGIAYYDKVVDACLAAGIEPYITLYHWELPQALEERGGWLSRGTAEAFARYAQHMAAHFAGRVRCFLTLNEPECSYALGYGSGEQAPGKTLTGGQVFGALCNLLLAHGMALRAMRAAPGGEQLFIGIATTGRLCYPESETPDCIAAARQATWAVPEDDWMFTHHMVLDPICRGTFPDCTGTALAPLAAAVPAADLALMHAAPDFLGLNIYNGRMVRRAASGAPEDVPKYRGFPRTAMKWPVTPEVMHWGVRFVYERYGLPLFISENGQSCNDRIFLDGKVHDPDRIDFLHRYLLELAKAAAAGADVRGYLHWCFTDNFEWSHGYKERFGLVYVDYPTLRRIPKDSAAWYAAVAAANGENL